MPANRIANPGRRIWLLGALVPLATFALAGLPLPVPAARG